MSIISIFIAVVIIAPIVSYLEERRYLALKFFVKIPLSHREKYSEMCNAFKDDDDDEVPVPADEGDLRDDSEGVNIDSMNSIRYLVVEDHPSSI